MITIKNRELEFLIKLRESSCFFLRKAMCVFHENFSIYWEYIFLHDFISR